MAIDEIHEETNFEKMGLDPNLNKGIISCGYKTPTPIQQKVIPIACQGKDVVVMARTGSGKTCAFLVPLFQRLKSRNPEAIRSLIILPTRDLAIQTVEFIKQIGKYMDLTCALVIGGESMDDQFMAVLQNPDILVGTPGRILHLLTLMNIKCTQIETIIIDEADRLYEMGFSDDLKQIFALIHHHQTILVSATLPKSLITFASLGMNHPQFVRLDFDAKISERLHIRNLYIRPPDKLAALIYLLTCVISHDDQTVIFTATRYHTDMVNEALTSAGIPCSISYSKMDEQARLMHLNRFRMRSTKILISTDISARGLDIPLLDNVINFNFPTTPKLFVHRVGRVARADRDGVAYSLISKDELPCALELYSFLGKLFKTAQNDNSSSDDSLGSVPQNIIDEISATHNLRKNKNITSYTSQIENAEKKLKRFTTKINYEFVKEAKSINLSTIKPHPLFKNDSVPVFTTLGFQSKSKPIGTGLDKVIEAREKLNIKKNLITKKKSSAKVHVSFMLIKSRVNLAEFSGSKIRNFLIIIKDKHFIDPNFIPYKPKDYESERGYKIDDVKRDMMSSGLDLVTDEINDLRQNTKKSFKTKWDRKQKKYVNVDVPKVKKVKTESGIVIDASYTTDHYKKWLKKTGLDSIVDKRKITGECAKKVKEISYKTKDEAFSKIQNPHAKRVPKKSKHPTNMKNRKKINKRNKFK